MTRSGRLLGGRYQLRTVLGRGGMATVWAGVDTRLDRPVAVKVLDASLADPAVPQPDREARALARLAHANIVAVHDVGTDDGVAFVVMELVEGEDLRRRLGRGPVDPREAVEIAAQVCDALEAAHRAGVVHLDVKPENILLTRTGVVKVCDFGIARLQQASQPGSGRGSTVGTAEYMAPEQATGTDVGARADLYALGCVLYRMLADRPVFPGGAQAELLWLHAHQPPTALSELRPDLPSELAVLVGELLAKNPADRPATAGEVRARLSRLSRLSGLAGPSGRPDPAGFSQPGRSDSPGAHPGRDAATVGPPPRAWSGTAPVVARTRMMPALGDGGQAPARPGFHLGPAGIVIVAVSAAIIAAVAVSLAMAPWQGLGSAAPGTDLPAGVSSAPTEPTAGATAAGTVDAVRAAIAAQVVAGQLDPRQADDLARDLDAIERHLARDDARRAADRIDELRHRVDELQSDDRLTDTGHAAIMASIDQLAATLPDGDGDED